RRACRSRGSRACRSHGKWMPTPRRSKPAAGRRDPKPFRKSSGLVDAPGRWVGGVKAKTLIVDPISLLARETLGEREILEVTGLPPAPALETGTVPATGRRDRARRSS